MLALGPDWVSRERGVDWTLLEGWNLCADDVYALALQQMQGSKRAREAADWFAEFQQRHGLA